MSFTHFTDHTRTDIDSSFLPQDKVAEFAKMKPTEVLKETMSAAGDVRLQNWFKDLVKHDANRYSLETVRFVA